MIKEEEAAMQHPGPYRVRRSVKGAMRVLTSDHGSLSEAAQVAARWRRSNSTGEYIAQVFDANNVRLEV
jgi:hypothetical protein